MPYAELGELRLYYERAGSGETELVFVPGCVRALDLCGCGQSDQPEGGYAIPDLADDLARFRAKVGIDKPVVVGHSLGGMIGIELAARHPSVPRALILVDPRPIDPLPATVKIFRAFLEPLEGPNGEEVRRSWVQDMGTRDEKLARWIVDLMCAVPLQIATEIIRGVNAWNGVDAPALCTVPTLLLRSSLGDAGVTTPARPSAQRHRTPGHSILFEASVVSRLLEQRHVRNLIRPAARSALAYTKTLGSRKRLRLERPRLPRVLDLLCPGDGELDVTRIVDCLRSLFGRPGSVPADGRVAGRGSRRSWLSSSPSSPTLWTRRVDAAKPCGRSRRSSRRAG